MDSWEEGFDHWTPSQGAPRPEPGDDTGTDLDRVELLRLARELADSRRAPATDGDAEVEQLKHSLRERAEAIAARERELADLQRKFERTGIRGRLELRPKRVDATADGETIAARERATYERAQALEERERVTLAEAAALEAGAAGLAERERELAEELAAAEATRADTEAERALAVAERERLEERDRAMHEREKQLAAERTELGAERRKLDARARALEVQAAALMSAAADRADGETAKPDPRESEAALEAVAKREKTLAKRESKLDESEQELTRRLRELDADRNALLQRERSLRRLDVAGVRDPHAQPFAPPSFSEGLASLARSRSRR
jgi:chromosome segregation ATPase